MVFHTNKGAENYRLVTIDLDSPAGSVEEVFNLKWRQTPPLRVQLVGPGGRGGGRARVGHRGGGGQAGHVLHAPRQEHPPAEGPLHRQGAPPVPSRYRLRHRSPLLQSLHLEVCLRNIPVLFWIFQFLSLQASAATSGTRRCSSSSPARSPPAPSTTWTWGRASLRWTDGTRHLDNGE